MATKAIPKKQTRPKPKRKQWFLVILTGTNHKQMPPAPFEYWTPVDNEAAAETLVKEIELQGFLKTVTEDGISSYIPFPAISAMLVVQQGV